MDEGISSRSRGKIKLHHRDASPGGKAREISQERAAFRRYYVAITRSFLARFRSDTLLSRFYRAQSREIIYTPLPDHWLLTS
jgi:hypothetical protein